MGYTPTEVGHIFGTNSCANVGIHKEKHTEVGHIFGTNSWANVENTHIHLLHMIHMVHDTYDTHETKSQNSWSHFWGKFEKHTFVIYDM